MSRATWQCGACDTYNHSGAVTCAVCETVRPATPPKAASAWPAAAAAARKKPVPPSRKKPAPAPPPPPGKKAAEPAEPAETTGPAAARGPKSVRVSREIAALMPDVFHPDGTMRDRAELPGFITAAPFSDLLEELAPPDSDGVLLRPSRPAARTTPAPRRAAPGPAAATAPPAPEPTPGQTVFACGCLLVLVGALITGIVLLVLHWGAAWHAIGHRHHGSDATAAVTAKPAPDARPTATVAPGTPRPKELVPLMPDGSGTGSVLLAVHIKDGHLTRYAEGVKKWSDPLTPHSAL